jgi:hypothetical protein
VIRLAQLLNEIDIGEGVPIGDGYVVKRLGQFGTFWRVIDDTGEVVAVFYVILKSTEGVELKIPWVESATILASHRGKGLYRRVLPIMKDTYGHIRSDNRMEISPEAEKAWKSLNAKQPSSTDDRELYGYSQYVL